MVPDRALNVLAFLEADTVTGPAANLLQFHRVASAESARAGGRGAVRLTLAVFQRGRALSAKSALCAAANAAGVAVVPVPEHFRCDPRAVAALRRLTDAVRPDVVQTHSVKSHLLVRLAALTRRYPWIAFHHGHTRPDLKMAVYNQFDRVSLRGADRIVAPPRAFVGELEARGVQPRRIVVLHNAFDVRREQASLAAADRGRLRESFGIAGHERIVACVGRLSKEKGHGDLIDALAILRARNPTPALRLLIAGDGPERDALVARAARAGVADAIRWLGYVPCVQQWFAAADAAVLPSPSEGSPTALLEAAAYQCPIVATDVGGVPEILVHGESGLLVPPHRPDALAAALDDVLADPQHAAEMGRLARAVVETRHDPAARARADRVVRRRHRPTRGLRRRGSAGVRVLMVMHAPPCSPALGPARRHLHLFEEISRRHTVSIITLGSSANREQFEREHAGCYERAVFISKRPRVAELIVGLWYLMTRRCVFRRLYMRTVQQSIDRAIARGRFDSVYFSTVLLGYYRVPRGIRVVGDAHNVEHEVLARAAAVARNPLERTYYRLQARVTRRDEEQLARRFSEVWATSARDAERFATARGDRRAAVVPNGVRCQTPPPLPGCQTPPALHAPVLLFVGLMSSFPNSGAVAYFVDRIFPLIAERIPQARFVVVGANPSRRIRSRATRNVSIVGRVPSVEPYFRQASAFVVPLRCGGAHA